MSDTSAPTISRPRTVSTAITLVWVALGLWVLGTALDLVSVVTGDLTVALDASAPGGEPIPARTRGVVLAVVLVVTGVISLLCTGFGVLLAMMLRAGRSWPRVVLAVIAGLYALGLLLSAGLAVVYAVNGPSALLPTSPTDVSVVVDVLMTAALVASVVLLFRRPSSAWFAERRAQRLRADGQKGVGLPGGEGWFPQGGQQPDRYR